MPAPRWDPRETLRALPRRCWPRARTCFGNVGPRSRVKYMMLFRICAAVIVLLVLLHAAVALDAQQPPQLAQFLSQSVKLEAAQVAAIERGEPVVRVLDTQHPRDIAVFGVIATSTPRVAFVNKLSDFRTSLANPTRVRF